jgi:hypothetical protein
MSISVHRVPCMKITLLVKIKPSYKPRALTLITHFYIPTSFIVCRTRYASEPDSAVYDKASFMHEVNPVSL